MVSHLIATLSRVAASQSQKKRKRRREKNTGNGGREAVVVLFQKKTRERAGGRGVTGSVGCLHPAPLGKARPPGAKGTRFVPAPDSFKKKKKKRKEKQRVQRAVACGQRCTSSCDVKKNTPRRQCSRTKKRKERGSPRGQGGKRQRSSGSLRNSLPSGHTFTSSRHAAHNTSQKIGVGVCGGDVVSVLTSEEITKSAGKNFERKKKKTALAPSEALQTG